MMSGAIIVLALVSKTITLYLLYGTASPKSFINGAYVIKSQRITPSTGNITRSTHDVEKRRGNKTVSSANVGARVFGSRKALNLHERKRCYSLDVSEKLQNVAHLEEEIKAWRKTFIA